MTRSLRAALMVLVLLLQGLGSAWALPPEIPAAQEEQQQAGMPCHDDQGEQDSMPCCDDDDGCRCSAACLGAAGALAPRFAGLDEIPETHPLLAAGSPGLLPPHALLLLRPPASSGS